MPFLLNPLTRYLLIAIVVLATIGGVYVKGRSDGKAIIIGQIAVERAKWEAKVAKLQSEAAESNQQITKEYLAKIQQLNGEIAKLRKKKNKVIVKTVTQYVPVEADKPVNEGFVDIHDTAAQGKPLSEEPKPNAAKPSEQKLSDVAATVAENYYICNATTAQLEALQKVVKEFQERQKALK